MNVLAHVSEALPSSAVAASCTKRPVFWLAEFDLMPPLNATRAFSQQAAVSV